MTARGTQMVRDQKKFENHCSRGLYKERYCRIEVMSELKCMSKMPSGVNKM